jgi:DNA-binding CsgD family transcriptional regulator
VLVGRVDESGALDRVLAGARNEVGGALVLRGPAGIGKTALLDWAVGRAADMHVTRVAGLESEVDLGFAGLHQVLVPFLARLERLPPPQHEALGAAFGLIAGAAPDRFLVGLATLTLITEAAVERPVLCVIDDAQWLDRVSLDVLGFVARRLLADRVAMIFAVREGEQHTESIDGLPALTVGPLPDEAALELLAMAAGQVVEQWVGARIVAETARNALALVEFGGALTSAQASGTAPLAEPLRFCGPLDELYRSRVRALPTQARQLLALAAADQLGQPDQIWEAAGKLGLDPELASLPAIEQLVVWEPAIRFRHPLMRSAAYYASSGATRRRVHEALAAVYDPVRDRDRRAWHLADAALGPDEYVAAELEQAAARARRRGGWSSGAAFLERSAELTPDVSRGARRLLDAAEARFVAGEAPAVLELVERAAPGLGDLLDKAQARRLEGLSLYAAGKVTEAATVLLDAAATTASRDPRVARDIMLDALVVARFAWHSDPGCVQVLAEVVAVPLPGGASPTLTDQLLEGMAAVNEQRYADGVALLRRAILPLSSGQPLPEDVLRYFLPVSMASSTLFDDSAWHDLEHRWIAELRRRGALGGMLVGLVSLAYNQMEEGRFADAEVTIAEGRELSEATGFRAHLGLFAAAELAVLARRGREAEARAHAARLIPQFTTTGYGLGAHTVRLSLGQLEISLGNYEAALRVMLQSGMATGATVDLIEAGTRSGDIATATAALDGLAPLAAAAQTPAALGWLALCQAMIRDDDEREHRYQEAIEYLRRCRHVPMLARARLLYGEWLRRQRRRKDAREQLNAAFEMFSKLGMDAFAERARVELRATGGHARKRTVDEADQLTPQELQIALLASEGESDAEIAARLFISASTVDYHLRKVFRKLGITSRVRIAHALNERGVAPSR